LFVGYIFVLLLPTRWYAAKWSLGVQNLIMNGGGPAHVPDVVIREIKSRERRGLVELPRPRGLQRGDQVRILSGPFSGRLALYAGQAPHERVAVLLQLLGGQQRTELPAGDIEPLEEVAP
jgi:transcriptional antiterminator RfaH